MALFAGFGHSACADGRSVLMLPVPDAAFTLTGCATDPEAGAGDDQQVDTALPHLSFAAGLMAAAEILKLNLAGYAMTPNRSILYTKPALRPALPLRLARAGVPLRQGCLCGARSHDVRA